MDRRGFNSVVQTYASVASRQMDETPACLVPRTQASFLSWPSRTFASTPGWSAHTSQSAPARRESAIPSCVCTRYRPDSAPVKQLDLYKVCFSLLKNDHTCCQGDASLSTIKCLQEGILQAATVAAPGGNRFKEQGYQQPMTNASLGLQANPCISCNPLKHRHFLFKCLDARGGDEGQAPFAHKSVSLAHSPNSRHSQLKPKSTLQPR
eukprot:1158146-Pelagomonas_calceolata.AAC.3